MRRQPTVRYYSYLLTLVYCLIYRPRISYPFASQMFGWLNGIIRAAIHRFCAQRDLCNLISTSESEFNHWRLYAAFTSWTAGTTNIEIDATGIGSRSSVAPVKPSQLWKQFTVLMQDFALPELTVRGNHPPLQFPLNSPSIVSLTTSGTLHHIETPCHFFSDTIHWNNSP